MMLSERELHVPLEETKAGHIVGIILSLISMGALSVCLSRRVQDVKDWSRLPLVCWLVLVIYLDSIAFVVGTAILSNGFGISSSSTMCSRAILLCLGCYMTTKLLYYFLVERVYIIRRSTKPRMRDPLYLFNSFGMLIPYLVVIILNFYFRFAIYEDGKCRIGMKRVAMIPLVTFDVLVNVYLTSLFLMPLRATYSYQNNRNSHVRTVALRTFIGSCATLFSSVVNLTFVIVLNGEPGWICLMCCNCDILFSVLVLHWITSKDNASTMKTKTNPSQNHDQYQKHSRNKNTPYLNTPYSPTSPSKRTAFPNPSTGISLGMNNHISSVADYEFSIDREEKPNKQHHQHQQQKSVVTTMVTANDEHDFDEEFGDDGYKAERLERLPNAITVESTHVREVEVYEIWELPDGNLEEKGEEGVGLEREEGEMRIG